MSLAGADAPRPVRANEGLLPAALVLVFTLGVVLVRPPLPVDETRYLEVFRESLQGSPLLLRLLGEPYAEKTPLLFWLGRALTWLALPTEFALRCVPALASALTVWLVARLGARAGLTHAGWLQAALLLPALVGQFLLFDPLVALGVWAAVDAWVRRREVALAGWSAFALLAKGPVAMLFLIPFLWGTRPLRGIRPGDAQRAALALALALVPLAAWALAAAARGGPEFADALLWERWGGRLGQKAAHARSWAFYLPIVLLGALPATGLLFGRGPTPAPPWIRRVAWALGLLLLTFTLIRGKQAHYLVPAAPALALWLAWRIEGEARTFGRLAAGLRIQLGLLACAAGAAWLLLPGRADSLATHGREWLARGGAGLTLGLAGGAALAGLAATFRARLSVRALIAVGLVSSSTSLLAFHHLAGKLLYPNALAEALAAATGADSATPIAYLGTSHHGVYSWLSARDDLRKLGGEGELAAFCAGPAGLVLIDARALPATMPERLVHVTSDVVHRSTVQVWRLAAPAYGALSPP